VAWERGLHLASALFWQEILGEAVVLATYDRELWEAARRAGLGGLSPREAMRRPLDGGKATVVRFVHEGMAGLG